MYCIRHIQNFGIFRTCLFRYLQALLRSFWLIQAYSAPCVTLAYSQHCHIPSRWHILIWRHIHNPKKLWPGIFRTLPYSGQLIQALFSHNIQPCVTLAYAETWNIPNPGIFKILPWLHPNTYSELCHIYRNRYRPYSRRKVHPTIGCCCLMLKKEIF